jgi:hypothetical protein
MQRAASRPVAGGASLDNGSLARLFWRALDAVTTGSCRRGCGAWMRSTALSRRPRPIGSGGVIARTSRACSALIERRGSPWPSPLDPALAAPSREHRPLFRCPPGRGDFVKVDCAACHHVALLTVGGSAQGRSEPRGQGSRPQGSASVCGCGRKERAVVSIKWRGQSA